VVLVLATAREAATLTVVILRHNTVLQRLQNL